MMEDANKYNLEFYKLSSENWQCYILKFLPGSRFYDLLKTYTPKHTDVGSDKSHIELTSVEVQL